MIKQFIITLEYEYLENTPESISDCQKFFKHEGIPNYEELVKQRGGILHQTYSLFEFGSYIVKTESGRFQAYTPEAFINTFKPL